MARRDKREKLEGKTRIRSDFRMSQRRSAGVPDREHKNE